MSVRDVVCLDRQAVRDLRVLSILVADEIVSVIDDEPNVTRRAHRCLNCQNLAPDEPRRLYVHGLVQWSNLEKRGALIRANSLLRTSVL